MALRWKMKRISRRISKLQDQVDEKADTMHNTPAGNLHDAIHDKVKPDDRMPMYQALADLIAVGFTVDDLHGIARGARLTPTTFIMKERKSTMSDNHITITPSALDRLQAELKVAEGVAFQMNANLDEAIKFYTEAGTAKMNALHDLRLADAKVGRYKRAIEVLTVKDDDEL